MGTWCCGLFIVDSDEPVPLISVHFDVNVKGFAGSVTVNQTYKNAEKTDLECVYGFPMNDQAAISGFTVKIDDRVLTSQFKKKDEAFKEYNEALQRGDGAYLLDQADRSDDTFVLSVGRLPPGKECVVSITYVCTLDSVTETKQRLVIPMALFPRCNPKPDSKAGQSAPPEKYASAVPYKATLDAKIETLDQVKSISSVSHPIAVTIIGPNAVQVTFGDQEQPLDRDVLVNIEISNNPQHHVLVEHVDGDQYVGMYAFVPHFEKGEEKVQSELVFLVDCSGSMQGDKIEDAKRAMQIFLRSIPEGCCFNFYRFGSNFESLFPESKLYAQDTFKIAKDYADATYANLGGTEILEPLKNVFSTAPLSGFSRQLFILTDGEVSNTEEVIDLVKKNASSSRVFSFGIGDSCSRSLINGIALAGNGKSEFCKRGEILEDKIGRHLERALQPAVVQASVLWEGVKNVQQVPYVLPPVFRGDRQIAYAFFETGDTEQISDPKVVLQLKGNLTKQTNLVFPDGEKVESVKIISKLASRALIKYLETSPVEASQSAFGGSLQTRKFGAAESRNVQRISDMEGQITEISLKHGVMSKYVSLLAVEKRESGHGREMQLREVSVQGHGSMMQMSVGKARARRVGKAPSSYKYAGGGWGSMVFGAASPSASSYANGQQGGWGSSDSNGSSGSCGSACSPSVSLGSSGFGGFASRVSHSSRRMGSARDEFFSGATRGNSGQGATGLAQQPVLNQLLDLQQWDGSWDFSADLERLMGVKKDAAQKKCGEQLDATVLATLLVKVFLEIKHANQRQIWQMIARKALFFIHKHLSAAKEADLLTTLETLF